MVTVNKYHNSTSLLNLMNNYYYRVICFIKGKIHCLLCKNLSKNFITDF